MILEFVGQSVRDSDNIAADPSRLVNLYREKAGDGTSWLKSVLGMMPHAALPGVFVTAMGVVDGSLYAVCGGRLLEITASGSFADLGAVDNGPATIAGNNGFVTVQAGTRYFVWNGTVMSEPAAGAFSGFGSVEFFGNYTILTEDGGRMFQWSDLADPTDLPGLNFSTADGHDDNLVRAMSLHGRLYLFKETSHETWYLTGDGGAAALERTAGGVHDIGLKAHGLICRFDGGGFMVGSDNRASVITAGGIQPVSTPSVETAIRTMRPEHCLTYSDEGHEFLCITFRDAPAWCYDIATGEWHERAEGPDLHPWRAAASARFGDDWYIGRDDGDVTVLQRSDADGPTALVREATSRTLYIEGERRVMRELEFTARQGFANVALLMQVSRDGGITWGPWKSRSLGAIGQYDLRCNWRNLGQFRRFNARIRWTDEANVNVSTRARVTA